MGKFVSTVVWVADEDEVYPKNRVEQETEVLSATVKFMGDYYEQIFSGLDAVLLAAGFTKGKNK